MKKLLFLTVCLFMFVIAQTQSRPVLTTSNTTLQGVDADTITLNVMTEKDELGVQLIATHVGSGDSLDFSYIPYIRNTYTGAWTATRASVTVSGTTDALVAADPDAYIYYSPFKNLQLRFIITGISTDTVKVSTYAIQK